MRWRGGRRSGNVVDRRGISARGMVGGGIGTVVLVVAALLMGVDPSALLRMGGGAPAPSTPFTPSGGAGGAPRDSAGAFADVVLAQTEDAWHQVFEERNGRYAEPSLVLFTDAVQSACGTAGAAVGPFYCPRDQRLYLDLGFFDRLARLGGPGDFARGYVIAHEVGHHVQNLTGAMSDFRRYGESGPESAAVRLELQADCYAGIWGHYTQEQGVLEEGDLREALAAAAAIGDDNLQRQSQGYVAPESFTHGTAEQRARWFRVGFETGDPAACDTFQDI